MSSAASSSRLLQTLTTLTVTLPPLIYVRDNFYSLFLVQGSSMEPALYRGDVLLVRKADILPYRQWEHWTSAVPTSEEDGQNALKVIALDADSERPIGDTFTGYSYLCPPTIHKLGSVVVFRAPDAEKYPSGEYRVKRVVGLGGQTIRPAGNASGLKEVPVFGLWVEGDNQDETVATIGDDHDRSVDSRTYGPISKNLVIGVAERVVWPPSRWGLIPCITPPVPRAWWS
ncbi:hypothetical protein HJC23_005825 [Cyclotella cryptica]|uniref:Mitochondrial inner membrane protease subunit n=1 Tax=Cyclotella cryptica TaxID=29204 RepID=A0ABD3R1D1_9STRA|eukprot:CCRYP_000325-RA/>CCRYP_000325-RA protein AED:0.02 eAED:0.02 QI:211/-1/1/1/-1/1/1/567/228